MRKLLLALAAIFGLLLYGTAAASAESPIRLYLDNRQLTPEVPPQIMNNVTMVPVRVISEELGAKVQWSESDRRITVEKNSLKIVMQIDNTETQVNGKSERLEKAPVLWNGSTLLPVRYISEKMGLKVAWDGLTSTVSLYNPTTGSSGQTVPVTSAAAGSSTDSTVKTDSSTIAGTVNTGTAAGSASSGGSGTGSGLPEVTGITMDGDVIKITAASGTLQPKISTLTGPDRLIIDLPNTALGKTMNGQASVQNGEVQITHEKVSKIRYALFKDNPSTVRIVVDLKQKIEYNLLDSKNPLLISLAPSAPRAAGHYVVVLDAGHGGKDPGALSINGRNEKDFNLAVILKVAKLLEAVKGVEVKLTRSDDTFVELNDRVAIANDAKADVFVSVHANKSTKDTVKGVETYYTRDNSAALAALLHSKITAATGSNDRGVRTEDYRVTKATVMPAVLCEIGYLSNAQEEAKLFSEDFQASVAASIAAAIQEYLQIP